jgi:hypothetical protein
MKTSRFSFPRRVRIHGGECGAVARALHHAAQKEALMPYEQFKNSLISDEKPFLSQADLGKASGSTFNERKQMSTKTTLKRIALVAVSALGFGLMTSVPAAQATGREATSIVIGELPPLRVGETSYVPVKIYLPSATVGATDTITITAQITAAPTSGGIANAASLFVGGATTTSYDDNDSGTYFDIVGDTAGTAITAGTVKNGVLTSSTDNTILTSGTGATNGNFASMVDEYVITTTQDSLGYMTVYVKIKPDVAGTYSVLVATNDTGVDGYTAGDPSATFSVSTGSTPTSVTLTDVAGGLIAGGPAGRLVKVSLPTGTTLAGNENFTVTTSGAGALAKGYTSTSYTDTTVSLTASDFTNGVAYIQLRNTGSAAQTISLTVTGSGSLSSNVTTTKTYSVLDDNGDSLDMTYEEPSTTADYAMTNASESSDVISVTELSTSQALGFTFADQDNTDAINGYVTVTDSAGRITGLAGAKFDETYSIADGDEGLTLSFAAASIIATTTLFTVTIPDGSATTAGVASGATKTFKSVARANSAFTISPNSTFIAAPGAAIALTATLKDQFGAARAGQTVTITTSGRNNPTATTAVTDSSGKVTFTTADASTSTTALVDTVSFAATDATTSSVTINYANTAVGTVTVTGGNTTASVTSLTTSDNPISVGSSTAGTEAGAITITATVKDANGNALAGIPVSFTVAGDGVAFTTTSATKYTGSTGTTTGSLYAWKTGTYTYTVTAGGKTTTGTATFASTTATNARVVSATVAGNVVTGKVVDRFGNPVKGVTLYAVTTSPANIGGAFSTSGTSNAAGEVAWVVSGNGSVTISAVNPASPAGTTYGQTCALEGNRTCATASTAAAAYSATVAGTATTAEKFVGATFAPAGVASATVTVSQDDAAESAADAAAEAIDAANAATDAANLAAEAADAATVAAEEARDAADAATAAVEELATQVATLMAALKAQITTLANTVAKIAKKVRA